MSSHKNTMLLLISAITIMMAYFFISIGLAARELRSYDLHYYDDTEDEISGFGLDLKHGTALIATISLLIYAYWHKLVAAAHQKWQHINATIKLKWQQLNTSATSEDSPILIPGLFPEDHEDTVPDATTDYDPDYNPFTDYKTYPWNNPDIHMDTINLLTTPPGTKYDDFPSVWRPVSNLSWYNTYRHSDKAPPSKDQEQHETTQDAAKPPAAVRPKPKKHVTFAHPLVQEFTSPKRDEEQLPGRREQEEIAAESKNSPASLPLATGLVDLEVCQQPAVDQMVEKPWRRVVPNPFARLRKTTENRWSPYVVPMRMTPTQLPAPVDEPAPVELPEDEEMEGPQEEQAAEMPAFLGSHPVVYGRNTADGEVEDGAEEMGEDELSGAGQLDPNLSLDDILNDTGGYDVMARIAETAAANQHSSASSSSVASDERPTTEELQAHGLDDEDFDLLSDFC